MNMSLPEFKPEVIERLIRMGKAPRIFDDAFTARVLKQMEQSGLVQQKPGHTATKMNQDVLKYSVLVAVMKKEKSRKKLPISMEVNMVKLENKLIEEKLLKRVKAKPEITDLGLRFMRDFEQSHTEK